MPSKMTSKLFVEGTKSKRREDEHLLVSRVNRNFTKEGGQVINDDKEKLIDDIIIIQRK